MAATPRQRSERAQRRTPWCVFVLVFLLGVFTARNITLVDMQQMQGAFSSTATGLRVSSGSGPIGRRAMSPAGCGCSSQECAKAKTLAYPLPAWHPFPALPMVMESKAGACDFCWAAPQSSQRPTLPSPCERISRKELHEPDSHVREALASALAASGCLFRADGDQCHVLDGGGNMGFFTMYSLAMGADVV